MPLRNTPHPTPTSPRLERGALTQSRANLSETRRAALNEKRLVRDKKLLSYKTSPDLRGFRKHHDDPDRVGQMFGDMARERREASTPRIPCKSTSPPRLLPADELARETKRLPMTQAQAQAQAGAVPLERKKSRRAKKAQHTTPRQPPLYWPTHQGADLDSITALHNGSCSAALQSLGPLSPDTDSGSPRGTPPPSFEDEGRSYSSYAAGARRSRYENPDGNMFYASGSSSRAARKEKRSLASTQRGTARSHSQAKQQVSFLRSRSTPIAADQRRSFSVPKQPASPAANMPLDEGKHRVAPPPITRSRHEVIAPRKPPLHEPKEQLGKGARRVTIEVEMTSPAGQTGVMRYIASEGLTWAYAFWGGEKDPISEVRGFHYSPDTQQLSDQNGVGGQLVAAEVYPSLEALVSFANLATISHNIHLSAAALRKGSPSPRQHQRSSTLALVPGDTPAATTQQHSPTAASGLAATGGVTVSHAPFANSWGLFKSWLGNDPPDAGASTWGPTHQAISVRDALIELHTLSHDVPHCAVARRTLSHGTYQYSFVVHEGRGISIGLAKKTPALDGDLTKLTDGYSYSSVGEVWRHGKELIAAEAFGAGDRIGMHVDLIRGTMSFTKNAKPQNITFNKLIGAYRVVVCLRDPGSVVELQGEQQQGSANERYGRAGTGIVASSQERVVVTPRRHSNDLTKDAVNDASPLGEVCTLQCRSSNYSSTRNLKNAVFRF